MRLDFNVLWVEDQPGVVAAQGKAIGRNMAEEGFEFKPTICTGLDEVQHRLSDDLFTDEVDLILVDWDLGKGVEGQTVITGIRERIPYKDVVFYSAVTDTKKLKEASFGEGHEGVYFVHRNDLVDEVTSLFKSVVKKVLDLDHTRGIVMGATSDVDQMARECLLLAHDLLDEAGRAGVLEEMVAILDDKVPSLEKRVGKLKQGPTVAGILEAHVTFTANDGLRVLTRVLELDALKAHAGHGVKIKLYMEKVVPKRNILGHKVLSPEGKPGIAGMPGETISLDDLRALRRLLLELRQDFRDLHGALGHGS
jgi:hypothetical protein